MFSALLSQTEPHGSHPSSDNVQRNEEKVIEINSRGLLWSVAFLVNESHIVSAGKEGKIRHWRVEDGKETGAPMDAGTSVFNIAVSHNGKWVVSGGDNGEATVWDAERRSRMTVIKGHRNWVRAVDISPDGTRVVTGSEDKTACVWSASSGERLLKPITHNDWVIAVKFSPDGQLIATAVWGRASVRVYDSQNGHLLIEFSVQVFSAINQSIAWEASSRRLFALSHDGNIHYLDVSTGTTLSRWLIHSSKDVRCIAVARNGAFIAATAGSLVSFWDTTTHEQIGSIVECTHDIWSMAISATYDLVFGGETRVTLRRLRDTIPSRYLGDAPCKKDAQNEHDSIGAENDGSNKLIENLEMTIQELRIQLAESEQKAEKERDNLVQSLRAQVESSNIEVIRLGEVAKQLRAQLVECQQKADQEKGDLVKILEQKYRCEALYAEGRIMDVASSLLEITSAMQENLRPNKFLCDWLAGFIEQCVVRLERVGDQASHAMKPNNAVLAYSSALSLSPSTPNTVLIKWTSLMLVSGSVHETLTAATHFKQSRFVVHRVACDILEGDGRVKEAVDCFRHMQDELEEAPSSDIQRAQWERGKAFKQHFRVRCVSRLENLGDTAMESKNYDASVKWYSDALALKSNQHILLKRCKSRASIDLWEEVLLDAVEVTELNPIAYQGYEWKYAALHNMRRYNEAFKAFQVMLSKLEESTDPHVHDLRFQYVDATPTIQMVVEQTIRHMPRVLIDTVTGRLYDKTHQATAFEELPVYDELRSSMTTRLDQARIRREVEEFYQYVMFSHRWEPNEPTFQEVDKIPVYKLPPTPANDKLQNFCKLACSLRFAWAWSDTCCINQLDKGVQQESLISMFRWYRGSSLTIVHLLGVFSESQEFGCLWKSIWNTRGWTYQEYIASKVVQFYTADWKPYLGLDLFNHKESPIILSEMELAMKIAGQKLATLRPGLNRVRDKLYLASMRQTTREEDIAYSLFGIFNVALPVMYGEGNHAVGRLLEHILTRSDNVTLLAWTGSSGSQHSYLPTDLTVYNPMVPPHVPQTIEAAQMDSMISALRSSSPDFSLAVALYERLYDLPPLSLVAGRLRLPGIVLPLTNLDHPSELEFDADSELAVYRAMTPTLGEVEIKTRDDLSEMEGLLLIHPWISPLLDQDFSCGGTLYDLATRALRLVVRLRQPFGALLLSPVARAQYRRVATDTLIMVQIREEASLSELMDSVRTVDIQ